MITLQDLRTYLNYDSTITTYDVFLTGLINSAKRLLEKRLNWELTYKQRTFYLNGTGTKEIYLPTKELYIPSVIQYYDSTTDDFTDIIDVAGDTIEDSIHPDYKYGELQFLKDYYFPHGIKNIKVTAYSGFKCSAGTGTISGTISTKAITGVTTNFEGDVVAGDIIQSEGQDLEVASVTNDTALVTVDNLSATITGKTYVIKSVPDDIKQWMLEQAKIMFDDSPVGKGRLGLSSENVGSQATQSYSFKEIDSSYLDGTYRIFNI